MMIPNFELAIPITVSPIDPDLLRVIWIDEISDDGVGDNRLYEDFSGIDWDDVSEIIREESALLQEASQGATSADDFDLAANRIIEERYPDNNTPDGALLDFLSLDLGVMSAVAALSASGSVSTTSCRGHNTGGEAAPLVRFTTDETRLPLILAAVSSSGCGLLLDGDGMLQLYATNILSFVAFARDLLKARDMFSASQTEVAFPRLPRYADDFTTAVRRKDYLETLDEWESAQGLPNRRTTKLVPARVAVGRVGTTFG
jgi:hypothetical protein